MVRLLRENDPQLVKQLVVLEAEAFGAGGLDEWTLVPLIRHGRVFYLTRNGRISAAVQYMRDWENPRLAYLSGVAVAREMQGQGLGAELLRGSFAALAEEGITEIELTVGPDNTAAIELYKRKLGFEFLEYRPNEYGEGIDRWQMGLKLRESNKR